MMINSAKPNIKPDKALQDIVYKLVPGLFQREMERRQQFYASRPGPAASTTPEQRGEDTERIIFSPEDVISFSLEYADVTDTDSVSSKSSDSNEPQLSSVSTRRYLQCPAVVNISHLKKFLTMKFDIDSTQFSIDILYKRVPLPDYYTLMDVAYIYNWKRNEPMRFFYQITDYIAMRNRYGLFNMNRKGSHFRDLKSSPTPTDDTNASSPTPNLNEQGSEVSSGTDSPMPEDSKKSMDNKKYDASDSKKDDVSNDKTNHKNNTDHFRKNSEDDIEKSNFLNSFELTAKNQSTKSSPIKTNVDDTSGTKSENLDNNSVKNNKTDIPVSIESNDNTLKRKNSTPPNSPETKKVKIDIDKDKSDTIPAKISNPLPSVSAPQCSIPFGISQSKVKESDNSVKDHQTRVTDLTSNPMSTNQSTSKDTTVKEVKLNQVFNDKKPISTDQNVLKRPVPGTQSLSSPTKKLAIETPLSSLPQQAQNVKSVSPMKSQVNKSDNSACKPTEIQKPPLKKLPDLKLSVPPTAQVNQNKNQTVNKVRMDLLANNSDPTIDRSKILSQVKTSLSTQSTSQVSGDHLKSLFDSCKINIPSSLSITLTDQKLDQRNLNEPITLDPKKPIINKNLSLSGTNSNVTHKVPSPPVHNYIEILKLPDVDSKKLQNRGDSSLQNKSPTFSKSTETNQPKSTFNKTPETTSAKGPMPSLKPIADTKLGKSSSNFSKPTTFQQTFLQSLQQSEKSKLPKNKMQVPKLMPATHKGLSAGNKDNSCNLSVQNKNSLSGGAIIESKTTKSDSVLDLSTPHTSQTQLGDQSKVLETMQSIANLAKKQNLPPKGSTSQSSTYTSMSSRPLIAGVAPLRLPNPSNPIKPDKIINFSPLQMGSSKQDTINKPNPVRQGSTSSPSSASASYQMGPHNSPIAQLSPRSQTRSPSSSPKLVIAEDKQSNVDININQSNQVSSTQLANPSASKCESPKPLPGPSKPVSKPLLSKAPGAGKLSGIRPPLSNVKPSSSMSALSGILNSLPPLTPQEFLRHRMDVPWMLTQAQQYENLLRNVSSGMYSKQNTFNNKESK
ncbi:Polycomb group protein Psc [Eumeta japonica]|uniref:Polycomb group protein Psc n=1 Tax=Eumeta variegata TaxID=151549 RepID=A0A4C1TCL0_EUMVA|nr:Polycomb group protein Psc [Eumeta japonica]